MFMIVPSKRGSPHPSLQPMNEANIDQERPEESRSRVRKACNRCRLKKTKCNGQMPCARCERDHASCRADVRTVALKQLSRSYISSLEEQQVTLLSALRELNRRAPDDQAVRETILQLERRGFEINSLKYDDPTRAHVLRPSKSSSESAIPEAVPWVNSEVTIDDFELFLQQPATPQVVSDLIWNFGDPPSCEDELNDADPARDSGESFSNNVSNNTNMTISFVNQPMDFSNNSWNENLSFSW